MTAPLPRFVYIAGHALVCASGTHRTAVAQQLWAGEMPQGRRTLGERSYPYLALPLAATDWTARAREALALLTAQLPELPPPREMPLFVASSSLQVGRFEQAGAPFELPRAIASYTRELQGWLGLNGPCHSFANACISGFSALEAATQLIATGLLEEALVLGFELANASTLAGFAAMQLLSPTACRPLDAHRDGLVLGEAVAAVHLSARPGPWRVAGVRTGLDAYSPTSPDPSGTPIARLARACLADAGLAPEDIELVKLQAAGSPGTDAAEAQALRSLFPDTLPPLLSLKPYLGHTLGASGIAELSALLACLEAEQIPATPGFAETDPQIGLQPTLQRRQQRLGNALLSLVGFGGGLAHLIVERP